MPECSPIINPRVVMIPEVNPKLSPVKRELLTREERVLASKELLRVSW
ncbi:MAG: hypothetical protein HXS54_15960 [Theionarchaea archaeon]|nr:hypothetical protein [Theionarchaea archaeon]